MSKRDGITHKRSRFAGTHNFWSRNEEAVCERCGAVYHKHHVAQRFCGCKKTKLQTTLEQSLVIQQYRSILKKFHLHGVDTFHEITGSPGGNFYYLTTPKLQAWISPLRVTRWCKLLERFNREFMSGYYDLNPWKKTFLVKRRTEPRKKECPQHLPHCAGGILPGTCPRGWRECPLAESHGLRCA